jgi:hypothetical protein
LGLCVWCILVMLCFPPPHSVYYFNMGLMFTKNGTVFLKDFSDTSL